VTVVRALSSSFGAIAITVTMHSLSQLRSVSVASGAFNSRKASQVDACSLSQVANSILNCAQSRHFAPTSLVHSRVSSRRLATTMASGISAQVANGDLESVEASDHTKSPFLLAPESRPGIALHPFCDPTLKLVRFSRKLIEADIRL